MASKRKPRPGDLVLVTWEDIAGSEGSHPETPVFCTPGYWVGIEESSGRRYVVTEKSRIVSGSSDYSRGWDRYPEAVVLSVEVV
jgi:hypothetical protein